MRKLIFLFGMSLFIQGCVKETRIETKEILAARQADTKVDQTFKVQETSKNIIELKKSALGKAYLLMPNLKSSDRAPRWSELKPQVVSFERSGARVGLFKLTQSHLYLEIPADKLIQTFEVVGESLDSISIDLGRGLTSLPIAAPYDILMERNQFQKDIEKDQSGAEAAVDVKDSFVRSVRVTSDRVSIEQVVRISEQKLIEAPAEDSPKENRLNLEKSEMSSTLVIELRPYLQNKTFTPLTFDRAQRIGAFTLLTPVVAEDYPRLYALRWDLSRERGPITLAISKNVPAEIIPAIEEAGEYWNRVLGQTVFVSKRGVDPGQLPDERMMLVRWIPWESAGFAYAGMQADPLTGEILRAQVFLTSSWWNYAKMATGESAGTQTPGLQSRLQSRFALCVLDQDKFKDLSLFSAPKEVQERATVDIIRTVVAHEMGHAIGMRHNFVGSMKSPTSDWESLEVLKNYLNDPKAEVKPLSSTVMDYTAGVPTAVNGAWAKANVFSYDDAFAKWAYQGKAIELEKYNYCSDEHVMAVGKTQKAIYGCDRFDLFRNPLVGLLYAQRNKIYHSVENNFRMIKAMRNANQYGQPQDGEDLPLTFGVLGSLPESLLKILFLAEGGEDPYLTVKASLKGFDSGRFSPNANDLAPILKADFKEVGGLSGVLKWLMPEAEQNDFFAVQVEGFFKAHTPSEFPFLTNAEYLMLKQKYSKAAETADIDYKRMVLAALIPQRESVYSLPQARASGVGAAAPQAPKKFMFRSALEISPQDVEAFLLLVEKNLISRPVEEKIQVNGQEVTLNLESPDQYNWQKAALMRAFKASSWAPISVNSSLDPIVLRVRKSLAENTVRVLGAAGVVVTELAFQDLVTKVSQLETSKVSASVQSKLLLDLQSLKLLESALK